MPEPTTLDPFEGQPVLSVGIEIPGAAGGLRESLKIDPLQLRHGERVFVVLETTVDKIRFDPVKDSDGWKRVHVLAAVQGMIVDASVVEAQLDENRRLIEAAKRAQTGEANLDDYELELAHEKGEHAKELVAGCPKCDAEAAAVAAEAAADKPSEPTSIADRRKRAAAGDS